MARANYRLDPFLNEFFPVTITEERHYVPVNSPYIIWLSEIPQKTDPTSIVVRQGSTVLAEVSAEPQANEFWPDYSTNAGNDTGWNTGRIKFHASRAGQLIRVSYMGLGSAVHVNNTYFRYQYWGVPGTYSFTIPQGVFTIWLSMRGGGGGGGGGGTGYSGSEYGTINGGTGGRGGNAQMVVKQEISVIPGHIIVVKVGVGGLAGLGTGAPPIGGGSGTSGTGGESSSFGPYLAVSGGGGGGGGAVADIYHGTDGANGANGTTYPTSLMAQPAIGGSGGSAGPSTLASRPTADRNGGEGQAGYVYAEWGNL